MRYQLGDWSPYIYRTKNYGQSWELIVNGIPNDYPVRVVREDPIKKNWLDAAQLSGFTAKLPELKNSNLPDEIRIGAVLRDDKVVIPRSNFVFQKDDRVVFLAKKDSISVVENIFRISSI